MIEKEIPTLNAPDSLGVMREGTVWFVFPPMPTVSDSLFPPIYPPLGILSLGTMTNSTHPVKLFDTACEGFRHSRLKPAGRLVMIGYPPEKTAARILEARPALAGFSCMLSAQMDDIVETCRLIKDRDNRIVTVVGGGHPSFLADRYLRDTAIDYVVHGEGEIPLNRLLGALRGEDDIRNVPGISWRQDNSIRRNPPILIENLDDLPLPRRDLLRLDHYFRLRATVYPGVGRKRNTNVMTSRGCPYKCRFCSSTLHWGHRFRAQSPDKVMEELWDLKKRYQVEEIQFFDDNFTVDRKRVVAILDRMLKEEIGLTWSLPIGVGVNSLDPELLALMRESGCYHISMAIESGNQEELDRQGKPLDLSRVKETIQYARKEGILIFGFFIVGYPGETREQYTKTISLAKTLPLHQPIIFGATPLVGTEFAQDFVKMGVIDEDYEYQEDNYFCPQFKVSEVNPTEILKTIVITTRKMLFKKWFRNKIFLFLVLYLRNTVLWPKLFLHHIKNHFLLIFKNDGLRLKHIFRSFKTALKPREG